VLAFPLEAPGIPHPLIGQIVISAETARRQAGRLGVPLATELDLLVTHGVLHLVGYDDRDPVEAGLVTSLARPGGNITGTAFAPAEVAGKQLALLKEALPKISRVAVLRDPGGEGAPRGLQEIQAAARMLGVTVEPMDVRDSKDFLGAFSAMARKRPDALITVLSPLTSAYRPIIVEFATKQRLPTMFGQRADVEAGGLMSYSPSAADQFRRTAGYVDRILKGARPGDLPIERPTKFELVVNLRGSSRK